jgi:hypothetical protein
MYWTGVQYNEYIANGSAENKFVLPTLFSKISCPQSQILQNHVRALLRNGIHGTDDVSSRDDGEDSSINDPQIGSPVNSQPRIDDASIFLRDHGAGATWVVICRCCFLEVPFCGVQIQFRRPSYAIRFDHRCECAIASQVLQYQQMTSMHFEIKVVTVIVEEDRWLFVCFGRLDVYASSRERMR